MRDNPYTSERLLFGRMFSDGSLLPKKGLSPPPPANLSYLSVNIGLVAFASPEYWYDEGTGRVFCLCEAPSKEAAEAVHREAHGLLADEITEVKEGA
jgi:hypothetical protein